MINEDKSKFEKSQYAFNQLNQTTVYNISLLEWK